MEERSENFIKGTCLTMCSNSEIHLRIKENLIHPLESKVDGNGQRLQYADRKKMVKEFSRSSAGHKIKASEVRPLPILQRTVKYLCSMVCSSEDASWREIYDFVNDRLRAVRQDLIVQGIHNKQVINVLAPAVRFYVYSHYRLCELDANEFDPYLNLQQLNETLLLILSIYKDSNFVDEEIRGTRLLQHPITAQPNSDSVSDDNHNNENEVLQDNSVKHDPLDTNDSNSSNACSSSENSTSINTQSEEVNGSFENNSNPNVKSQSEYNYYDFEDDDYDETSSVSEGNVINYTVLEEMVTLYLLIHIGNAEVISCVLEMPKKIRECPLIKKAMKASISWMLGNHVPLVRFTPDLTPILASALHIRWNDLQRYMLGVCSVAFNSKILTYSLEDLKGSLLYSSNQSLEKACQYYGLSISGDGVQFLKTNFKWDVAMLKPEKSTWIEEKIKNYWIPDLLLS